MKKSDSVLPGFGITLGFTVLYLSVLVLLPIAALLLKIGDLALGDVLKLLTSERVLAAFKLSFLTALIAAFINTLIGLLIAWVLARYKFPGKRIVDSFIDLPFALPTAVAGIALTSLYAKSGLLGSGLARIGLQVAYTPIGITLALIFVGLPFVVRTVQPILEELQPELEEAALCMGASTFTTFYQVIFPILLPGLVTGFTLAFARGIGEYGSVVFIAGNMPMRTEILPLLIMSKLEQFDYKGAMALSIAMLGISFIIMLSINALTLRLSRKSGVSTQ